MKYRITDEAALKAAFPQFITIKEKKITTVQQIAVLDQRAVKYAKLAGIAVPGVEECNSGSVGVQ